MIRILMDLCLLVGAIFALAGTVGVIRMPDVFCRMQASTCIATMGTVMCSIGCLLYGLADGRTVQVLFRIIFVCVLVIVTNPIASHALFKGAYKKKDLPETHMVVNEYLEEQACKLPHRTVLNGEEVETNE